jgi:DNA-binding NtrC family response regulator
LFHIASTFACYDQRAKNRFGMLVGTRFAALRMRCEVMKAGRMLVVDDSEFIRSLFQDYFKGHGYDVVTANDGMDALAKFTPGGFDCIISDVEMPRLGGIGLLKKVKLLDKRVKFLMMTGAPVKDDEAAAAREGAWGYMSKPLRMETMRSKIETMLQASKT